MRFVVPRRRSPSIQLAPLIDVLLLLLVFYIVTSRFRLQRGIDVRLPTAGSAESVAFSDEMVLTIGADGAMSLNGMPVVLDNLADELRSVVAAIGDEVRLELQADEAVPYGHIIAAIDAARAAGIAELTAFTRSP